jgi:DnaJ-class molecular chaperone
MARPETCPVCRGDGAVNWVRLDGSVLELKLKCPTCEGRGWVVTIQNNPHHVFSGFDLVDLAYERLKHLA